MTLGNKILSLAQKTLNTLSCKLHKLLHKDDEFHPTTGYRAGKRCVNICSYCGSDNTSRDGGVNIPKFEKQIISPIYISNIFGSNMVAYPQVTQCSEFITTVANKDLPLVCDNCGRAYSTTLVIKTLDIVVILYY